MQLHTQILYYVYTCLIRAVVDGPAGQAMARPVLSLTK